MSSHSNLTPLNDEHRNRRDAATKESENRSSEDRITWKDATDVALVGIFAILCIAALYLARSILMPVSAAVIIGITLSPIQKFAEKYRIPPFIPAIVLVAFFCGGVWLVVTLTATPLTEWIKNAPEFGRTLKEKLHLLDHPLALLHSIREAMGGEADNKPGFAIDFAGIAQQAVVIATPALTELVVFFGTLLFFLVGITRIRRKLITTAGTRETRLRIVRIWNEVEHNLITYLVTVTVINFGLGVVTAIMLTFIGFPNPIALGVLAAVLNYVPYIGAAVLAVTLLIVGLVVSATVGGALLAPALFVAIATIEGQVVTPNVVGHRLTLSPFAVFLALAFWAWLWGPLGAFMAAPLLIVGQVLLSNLFPQEETCLPK
jgi:predicted PurR-regulated permease PerM